MIVGIILLILCMLTIPICIILAFYEQEKTFKEIMEILKEEREK